MTNKKSLLSAIVLYLIISTTYYWEGFFGFWLMPLTLFLFLAFAALLISLLYQIFLSVKEKFSFKPRIRSIVLLAIILGLIIYQPINFATLEAEDLLIASREGSANCTITYKLKKDSSFIMRNVCFGIEKTEGNYSISGDTVRFKETRIQEKDNFQFAIIRTGEKNNLGTFTLYRSINDSIPLMLSIFKNDLKKCSP